MAPQPTLFKVFSVGQITSIKCCPLAAHRSAADAEGKREKNRGEGVIQCSLERREKNKNGFTSRSQSLAAVFTTLSHSLTRSVTRGPSDSFSI